MFSSFQLPQEGFARLAQAQLQHPERTPRVRATRQKVLGVCKGARRVWLQKAQIVGIDTVYFSHVAASAARCRRDNCLLWPRLVTAAACRVCRRTPGGARCACKTRRLVAGESYRDRYVLYDCPSVGRRLANVGRPRAPPGSAFVRLSGTVCAPRFGTRHGD